MNRYRLYAIADVLFTVFACLLVNWWAPLFAIKGPISSGGVTFEGYRLPDWLKWFDTFDADLDTGRRDGVFSTKWVYWGRVRWLYRNPTYGFSYWVLGTSFFPEQWEVQVFQPYKDGSFSFVARGPDGRFNRHTIHDGRRIKIGWKAWNMFDPATGTWKRRPWGPEWRVPFVFSISRFKQ